MYNFFLYAFTLNPSKRYSIAIEDRSINVQYDITVNVCLLLFYVLATSKVKLGWVPTCNSAHSWRFSSAAPWGNQALSQPVLALS